MSFSNVGPLTYITGGGTYYWWYAPREAGMLASSTPPPTSRLRINGPPVLMAEHQGKAKWNSGYTQYYVTISDVSSPATNCWYNLQGRGRRMKMTVITERGKLVGAMQGHAAQPDGANAPTASSDFRAGLIAGPGQKAQEIEVPDSLGKLKDPESVSTKR